MVVTEVSRKQPDQIDAPSRDGAYVHGLVLEGARWDDKGGVLDESKPKELFCPLPVILIKAVTQDKAEVKDAYQCPVYTTEARFRQEVRRPLWLGFPSVCLCPNHPRGLPHLKVFTAQLKSKHSWIKWTTSGVCAFLDVVM